MTTTPSRPGPDPAPRPSAPPTPDRATAGVAAAAAIPAAPLLLEGASPAQPAAIVEQVGALRAAVAATVSALPQADATLLVAGGDGDVRDHARASLAPLGVPEVAAELAVAADLAGEVAQATGAPLVRDAPLPLDLAVVVLVLASLGRHEPVVPLTVPASAAPDVLARLGASLVAAAGDGGHRTSLVVTGDLAATLTTTSPGYLVDGADRWDERAVAAVRAGDTAALARLGPDDAERVQARSWAPLVAAMAAAQAAGLVPADVSYHAPRGVGQLVARWVPPSSLR